MNRCIRSQLPFVLGWYAVVKTCLILNTFVNARVTSDLLKTASRSESSQLGQPNRNMICSKMASAIVVACLSGRGIRQT